MIYRLNDAERWIDIGRVDSRGEATYRNLDRL
jgi:hypothetical protein